MNKELEIQELAKEFCGRLDLNGHLQCKGCESGRNECAFTDYANIAYDAGYRKESDVAKDVLDSIKRIRSLYSASICKEKRRCLYTEETLLEIEDIVAEEYGVEVEQ